MVRCLLVQHQNWGSASGFQGTLAMCERWPPPRFPLFLDGFKRPTLRIWNRIETSRSCRCFSRATIGSPGRRRLLRGFSAAATHGLAVNNGPDKLANYYPASHSAKPYRRMSSNGSWKRAVSARRWLWPTRDAVHAARTFRDIAATSALFPRPARANAQSGHSGGTSCRRGCRWTRRDLHAPARGWPALRRRRR